MQVGDLVKVPVQGGGDLGLIVRTEESDGEQDAIVRWSCGTEQWFDFACLEVIQCK